MKICTVSIAALLAACPGTLEDPDLFTGDIDCASYSENLIRQTCATSNCHSTLDSKGDLDLEAPSMASRIVNVESNSEECGPERVKLVDLANIDASLMMSKVDGSFACGDIMPLFDRQLAQFEIDCMRSYLQTLPSP